MYVLTNYCSFNYASQIVNTPFACTYTLMSTKWHENGPHIFMIANAGNFRWASILVESHVFRINTLFGQWINIQREELICKEKWYKSTRTSNGSIRQLWLISDMKTVVGIKCAWKRSLHIQECLWKVASTKT